MPPILIPVIVAKLVAWLTLMGLPWHYNPAPNELPNVIFCDPMPGEEC